MRPITRELTGQERSGVRRLLANTGRFEITIQPFPASEMPYSAISKGGFELSAVFLPSFL
jgi:hypothetical protein